MLVTFVPLEKNPLFPLSPPYFGAAKKINARNGELLDIGIVAARGTDEGIGSIVAEATTTAACKFSFVKHPLSASAHFRYCIALDGSIAHDVCSQGHGSVVVWPVCENAYSIACVNRLSRNGKARLALPDAKLADKLGVMYVPRFIDINNVTHSNTARDIDVLVVGNEYAPLLPAVNIEVANEAEIIMDVEKCCRLMASAKLFIDCSRFKNNGASFLANRAMSLGACCVNADENGEMLDMDAKSVCDRAVLLLKRPYDQQRLRKQQAQVVASRTLRLALSSIKNMLGVDEK